MKFLQNLLKQDIDWARQGINEAIDAPDPINVIQEYFQSFPTTEERLNVLISGDGESSPLIFDILYELPEYADGLIEQLGLTSTEAVETLSSSQDQWGTPAGYVAAHDCVRVLR